MLKREILIPSFFRDEVSIQVATRQSSLAFGLNASNQEMLITPFLERMSAFNPKDPKWDDGCRTCNMSQKKFCRMHCTFKYDASGKIFSATTHDRALVIL
jgi:hypothetical protein